MGSGIGYAEKMLSHLLESECRVFVTSCVMQELRNLGEDYLEITKFANKQRFYCSKCRYSDKKNDNVVCRIAQGESVKTGRTQEDDEDEDIIKTKSGSATASAPAPASAS